MKKFIVKWLGLENKIDKLNGCQFEHHMRLLELESKVAKLENAKNAKSSSAFEFSAADVAKLKPPTKKAVRVK